MSSLMYYVIDTETTGLGKQHEIVELSAIRYSDRVQFSRTIKALNPKLASWDALQVTGKTYADLSNGGPQEDAIYGLEEFFSRDGLTPEYRAVVAHGCNFDMRFLHALWDKHERSFPAVLWLDTVAMSKRLAAQMGYPKAKVKLDLALDLFGIKKLGGLHTAKGDSRNTYFLFQHLLNSGIEYLDLIKRIPHREIPTNDESQFEVE